MNIYRFTFPNKETAVQMLESEKIATLTEEGYQYLEGTQAIVEVTIVDSQAEFDAEGNITKEAVLVSGYHFDVMSDREVESEFIVTPKTPQHGFLGFSELEEVLEEEEEVIIKKI